MTTDTMMSGGAPSPDPDTKIRTMIVHDRGSNSTATAAASMRRPPPASPAKPGRCAAKQTSHGAEKERRERGAPPTPSERPGETLEREQQGERRERVPRRGRLARRRRPDPRTGPCSPTRRSPGVGDGKAADRKLAATVRTKAAACRPRLTARASQSTATVTARLTTASRIVQPKSAGWGRERGETERLDGVVAGREPGPRADAYEHQRRSPAAQRQEEDERGRGAGPAASMIITAPTPGEPNSDAIAARSSPRSRHHPERLLGRLLSDQSDRQDRDPYTERDQRCLRAPARGRGRSSRGCQQHPVDRSAAAGAPPTGRPSARTWPPRPGSRWIHKVTAAPARANHGDLPPPGTVSNPSSGGGSS